jgi:hypothetical protein
MVRVPDVLDRSNCPEPDRFVIVRDAMNREVLPLDEEFGILP